MIGGAPVGVERAGMGLDLSRGGRPSALAPLGEKRSPSETAQESENRLRNYGELKISGFLMEGEDCSQIIDSDSM